MHKRTSSLSYCKELLICIFRGYILNWEAMYSYSKSKRKFVWQMQPLMGKILKNNTRQYSCRQSFIHLNRQQCSTYKYNINKILLCFLMFQHMTKINSFFFMLLNKLYYTSHLLTFLVMFDLLCLIAFQNSNNLKQ